MIVRTYKSIISPLNIWFCLYKTFTLHSLSCPARRAGAETEAARLLSFLSSLCSCPASPDWSALRTWWSVVWWWSRWAALRSGSGRKRSLWRFFSVPVLYCPSLETETEKRQSDGCAVHQIHWPYCSTAHIWGSDSTETRSVSLCGYNYYIVPEQSDWKTDRKSALSLSGALTASRCLKILAIFWFLESDKL